MSADASTTSRRPKPLGVLERAVLDGGYDLAPVLSHLQNLGLSDPSWPTKRALAVGLTHSSFLYEHPDLLPGVSKGLLDTLHGLGAAYITRLAAVRAYQRSPSHTAGGLSKQVSYVPPTLPDWAVRQAWLLQSCRLSVGLKGAPLPSGVAAILVRQFIGVLCVTDCQEVAEKLLEELVSEAKRSETIADPVRLSMPC